MPTPKRIVTKEGILHAARQAGLELSDQRAEELVPMLKAMLENLEVLREFVAQRPVEPALIFRVREE